MFTAINKSTGQSINAIDPNYSIEFFQKEDWYAEPSMIEICPENIDKTKIEIKYRKGSEDEIINKYGTRYIIAPHFFIPNAEKQGILTKEPNEDHKRCVNFIYNLIKENKLNFYISKATKPNEEKNIIKFNPNDIDWNRYDIEVTIKKRDSKRADIFLPFKKHNELLGFGIIIEVQLTEQRDNTYLERSYERANKGYSVIWIKAEDFEDYKSKQLKLKDNNLIVEDYLSILKKYKEKCINDIKEITINYSKMLDQREDKLQKMLDKIINPDYINCPKCDGLLTIKKGGNGNFYGCSSYPLCKYTINIK